MRTGYGGDTEATARRNGSAVAAQREPSCTINVGTTEMKESLLRIYRAAAFLLNLF